jgi:hypothetical protein
MVAFPATPQVGDQIQGPRGEIWEWDGERWIAAAGGGNGGGGGGPYKDILLLPGVTSWTAPPDFGPDNIFELWSGGGGGGYNYGAWASGGGGTAYARSTNLGWLPGNVVACNVGTGGLGATGTANGAYTGAKGGITWIGPSQAQALVLADSGYGGSGNVQSAPPSGTNAGQASASIGQVTYNGGNTNVGAGSSVTGGGGAAGPRGPGGDAPYVGATAGGAGGVGDGGYGPPAGLAGVPGVSQPTRGSDGTMYGNWGPGSGGGGFWTNAALAGAPPWLGGDGGNVGAGGGAIAGTMAANAQRIAGRGGDGIMRIRYRPA